MWDTNQTIRPITSCVYTFSITLIFILKGYVVRTWTERVITNSSHDTKYIWLFYTLEDIEIMWVVLVFFKSCSGRQEILEYSHKTSLQTKHWNTAYRIQSTFSFRVTCLILDRYIIHRLVYVFLFSPTGNSKIQIYIIWRQLLFTSNSHNNSNTLHELFNIDFVQICN